MTQQPKKPKLPANYQPLEGSERHPGPGARYLGLADQNETFSVTIVLRRRPDGPPLPDFDTFATNPSSRRWPLPDDEFTANYGAAQEDIDRIVQFAGAHGLTVVEVNAKSRTVVVSGTVAQMSQAFAVSLGRYQHEIIGRRGQNLRSETYRGRDGFIHIPRELAEIIVGVFGLDNRTLTKRNHLGDPPNTTTLTVAQVTKLYHFPTNSAAGQTIGIISPGYGRYSGYFQSDLQLYFGAALPTIIPISVDGSGNGSIEAVTSAPTPAGSTVLTFASTAGILVGSSPYANTPGFSVPNPYTISVLTVTPTTVTLNQAVTATVPTGTHIFFNPDWETTQDICIAAAAAPGANVAVYFSKGDSNGWVNLLQRAIHPHAGDPHCSVLSSSFYISDGDDAHTLAIAGVTAAMINAISAAFQDAAIQGVTVCIASGDTGSNSNKGKYPNLGTNPLTYGGDGKAHVQYPGSDPWVLSVGGTTIGNIVNSPPSFDEYVWNDPDPSNPAQWGTTGGGVSDFFPLPSYQNSAGVPASVNDATHIGRGVPDVAGNASLNSGFSGLFVAGQPDIGNGTSASAPLWAGLIAVINAALGENVGFLNPAIYKFGTSVFRDINPPPGPTNNSNSGIAGYSAGPGWDACTGWGSPNGAALLARWQIHFRPKHHLAIDPLALILRGDIYILIHLPDPPPIEVIESQVQAVVNTMPPAERKRALAQAKAFMAYTQALLRELEPRTKKEERTDQ